MTDLPLDRDLAADLLAFIKQYPVGQATLNWNQHRVESIDFKIHRRRASAKNCAIPEPGKGIVAVMR